jgi:glycerol uptake facilitator-like aquaporin
VARFAGRITCVILLLALSMTLFSAGFILSFVTLLLTFARFTGADVAPELLLQFVCAVVAATWASGVCWDKMRETAERQKRPDGAL